MSKLTPPDPARCQAEMREGSFMTLGPRAMIRCSNAPTVIVTENELGSDGQCGSMSLCPDCLEVFRTTLSALTCTIKEISS